MEDVLSLDDLVLNDVFQHWLPPIRRIPPLLLPRLHDELSSYMTQREANGTVAYFWYHRQFIFVARDRYLAKIGHRFYIHTSLAHYFLGTWGSGKCKPFTYSATQLELMGIRGKENDAADRKVPLQPLILGKHPVVVYNLRKLSELPYHLLESRQYLVLKQEVRSFVCTYVMVHYLCSSSTFYIYTVTNGWRKWPCDRVVTFSKI